MAGATGEVMSKAVDIRPQPGYQLKSLASPADIVIGGASAGVGKTFSLLLEPLRHIQNPDFRAVCFRRTSPQIRAGGGLWDTSMGLYPLTSAKPRESRLEWEWQSGARVAFRHLQYEKDKLEWQGSQVPLILWDELTHFSESMFFYLLTRNRSDCGVRPYVRATCNPDPESWVATLIAWWIDQETGFPIPERDGVIRYFTKAGADYIWGDTFEEVVEKGWWFLEPLLAEFNLPAEVFVKSITFISGRLVDNQALLSKDPAYLANLLAQDEETVMQLFKGNWKVVISDRDIYEYQSFVGMFVNQYAVDTQGRYITADIALQGSDKFIVGVWYGMELVDILIMPKSNGREVVDAIKGLAATHKVPNHHIAYDNDGVGGFIGGEGGFIEGARPFHNGGSPLEVPNAEGKPEKENYENLKTQCYYRSGLNVADGKYRISERVANMMYDTKMTVRQRFMYERKAIKRAPKDTDGKLKLIKKEEMKVKLGGESPDILDMFMIRELFNIVPPLRQLKVY
ncbi:terminase large subunit domain-containing protein [Fibrella forsythiae]|uniref:Terminase family protein n=1 Tax=Fibrella forsythiae TaxID=2817061 RepID=A0ABS3JC19_9BACT|nr:terminase family protein [Fibrella forsythiae]MBO0947540.1 terminase family protein [Fibrella forsythiae]